MKSFPILLLLALFPMVTHTSDQSSSGIFPFAFKVETLPNGLTCILVPLSHSGLVAYYSIVRTGSRDEWEPGHSGFAHFFEHMMFRGTEKYPGPEYDRLMTEMGVDGNASTTDDYTWYYMTLAKDNLEKVMELESDRFQNLFYKEAEFQTEAGAILGEYNKGRTSPFSVLDEKMQETAFDTHTYKHTTIGFRQDVLAMPTMYEYSKSFFKRYYRPENVVLVITGDIDPAATGELVRKYYSDWKPGYVAPNIQAEAPQIRERSSTVTFDGKTLPILAMAYKGCAFSPVSADVAAANALSSLAFSQSSDLYKKLVLKEQKVDFISADFSSNRDPGLWGIVTRVKDPGDVEYVKAEIDKTINMCRTKPFDAAKLDNTKKRERYAFMMDLETPARVASRVTRTIALTGRLDAVNEYYETMDKLTPADIQSVARKYFTPERRTIVVLTGGTK